uniref:Uncharacterized protein n=1 Tax=Aegilops tauschii subsp. strangulata TaxID=200361 RepID=A0A453G7Z8_AEGTS
RLYCSLMVEDPLPARVIHPRLLLPPRAPPPLGAGSAAAPRWPSSPSPPPLPSGCRRCAPPPLGGGCRRSAAASTRPFLLFVYAKNSITMDQHVRAAVYSLKGQTEQGGVALAPGASSRASWRRTILSAGGSTPSSLFLVLLWRSDWCRLLCYIVGQKNKSGPSGEQHKSVV